MAPDVAALTEQVRAFIGQWPEDTIGHAMREPALAALDALAEALAETEKQRDEARQAAEAEAWVADEFRARLVAAKTSQPHWTLAGWNQFIDAALELAVGREAS